ncbi:phage holin, lambda family [Azorhizophilus paspali]
MAWLAAHQPQIGAFALSAAVGGLRVVYGGGSRRQMLLEAALCGLMTLAAIPLLAYFGLPQSMATVAGGGIGFIGVEKLRDYSDRIFARKVEGQ